MAGTGQEEARGKEEKKKEDKGRAKKWEIRPLGF